MLLMRRQIKWNSITITTISSYGVILILWMVKLGVGNSGTNITKENKAVPNEKQQMLPYHMLPVYGNASLGYYYVNIYVGSPNPQPQSVIVDTGSGILALPCVNCKQCGHKNHINPPYNPQKSLSSKILTCEITNALCKDQCVSKSKSDKCLFFIHYAEGSSLEGILVQDDIRLESIGRNEEIKTVLGCTQKQTKLFFQQKANGIFGLAPRRQSNLLEELFNRHSPKNGEKRIFSLCLASNGGFMTVGNVNKEIHPNKVQPDISIPFKEYNNLYNLIGIKQIKMGEILIESASSDRIGGYNIIIDSGSTFSYVPQKKYNEIEKLLNITCIESKRCLIGRGEESICYKLLLNDNQQLYEELDKLFPAIRINLGNLELKWAATRYMLLWNHKKNQICMGLQPLNRYLLGANWMSNRNIVFDLDLKMIHIYDDIKCVQSSQVMGSFLSKSDGNPDLIFTNKLPQQLNYLIFIVIGIVICLVMIISLFCIYSRQKSKLKPTITIDEEEELQQKDKVQANTTKIPEIQQLV